MNASAIDYFADGYPFEVTVFPFEAVPSGPVSTDFCPRVDGFRIDLNEKYLERQKNESKTWKFPCGSFENHRKSVEISLEPVRSRFKSCAIEAIAVDSDVEELVSTLEPVLSTLEQFCFGAGGDVFSPRQRVFLVDQAKKPEKCPGYRVKLFFAPFEKFHGPFEAYCNGGKSCAITPIAHCTRVEQFISGGILMKIGKNET